MSFYAVHHASRPIPRGDVHNQRVVPKGPLSAQGHGRKMTPMQSQPGHSYSQVAPQSRVRTTHVRPQATVPATYVHRRPVHTHTTHVHYQAKPAPVVYPPAYMAEVYVERPAVNVRVVEQEPVWHHRYSYRNFKSDLSFAGFLVKCAIISALALFMLAILL